MKKFILLLAIVATFLISCDNKTPVILPKTNTIVELPYDVTEFHLTEGGYDYQFKLKVFMLEYNSHKYIIFSYGNKMEILHDPDCQCRVKNINEKLETTDFAY